MKYFVNFVILLSLFSCGVEISRCRYSLLNNCTLLVESESEDIGLWGVTKNKITINNQIGKQISFQLSECEKGDFYVIEDVFNNTNFTVFLNSDGYEMIFVNMIDLKIESDTVLGLNYSDFYDYSKGKRRIFCSNKC